jgi:hypothetical protein
MHPLVLLADDDEPYNRYATGKFAGAMDVGAAAAAPLPFFGLCAVANILWVAFTTYWRLTHFWFTHRMMHPWFKKVGKKQPPWYDGGRSRHWVMHHTVASLICAVTMLCHVFCTVTPLLRHDVFCWSQQLHLS